MKPSKTLNKETMFNLTLSEADILAAYFALVDQTNRYRKDLADELAKPLNHQDEDELLFLTTEYSKTDYSRRHLEEQMISLGIRW